MPVKDYRSNRKYLKVKPAVIRGKNTPKPTRKQNASKRNYKYSEIHPIWKNETVYIVGGGHSLTDFNWHLLKNKRLIAINRAFEKLPNADVIYWTDARFYKWYKNEIDQLHALKVCCRPIANGTPDIKVLCANKQKTIDTRPSFICFGNNSGYGAINLAVKLGAKKIYLLGYDMNSSSKVTHWHDGYKKFNMRHNHSIYKRMISVFEPLPKELERLGVEIWNANPKSHLHYFDKCTLSAAIKDQPVKIS